MFMDVTYLDNLHLLIFEKKKRSTEWRTRSIGWSLDNDMDHKQPIKLVSANKSLLPFVAPLGMRAARSRNRRRGELPDDLWPWLTGTSPYLFAEGFARPWAAGSVLFAVALEYLLRTSSAVGGPSRYPWTAEQYLRITPSYESRGKKAGGRWVVPQGKSAGDKGARERRSWERAIRAVETETETSGGLRAGGEAVRRN